ALCAMLILTVVRPLGVERVGWLLFVVSVVGVFLTPILGENVKGATRWINIAGFSLQPSEFLKPALVIVIASLMNVSDNAERLKRFAWALGIIAVVAVLLLRQPNVGMLILLGSVWGSMVFLAGVPMYLLLPMGGIGVGGIVMAYFSFSHVQSRIDRFMNPEGSDTYQADQSHAAIMNGHLFGRGAGEGVVKHSLPDAHTDFIFAVVAEEFGILICLALILLYLLIVLRAFYRMLDIDDRFTFLAIGGLASLLAFQVMINVGVAMHIMPTTGMTLPFISYGGSATLGMAISMGFLLALLRKRGLRL
ncbi:MAG: FtsW/RodA/SpoVE family cell cycle protein, partial [Alphaproteobacteria bacterium]